MSDQAWHDASDREDHEELDKLLRQARERLTGADLDQAELEIDVARRAVGRRHWVREDWPLPNPGESPRKLAILGYGPSRLAAPYGEEGWELWGLNDPSPLPGIPIPRAFTRWFQLHPPHYLAKHYPKGLKDLDRNWGEARGIRLYMDRHYPEYPDSEPYPKEEVEALTGHGWYHASSFDWMLALGILEGFEHIELFGCQFYKWPVMNGEPASALECLHYWIGVAEGRGIKTTVWGNAHIMRVVHFAAHTSRLQYGFEREPALDLPVDGSVEGAPWEDVR